MPAKWKDVRSKAKQQKRNKLAVIVLGLVVLFLILSWAVRFTQSLFTSSIPRNYHWDGEFNINLVVRTSSVSVLSYNPKEEKVTIINIPDETFVVLPQGFGKWQLRAVYGLGGNGLLKDTLTQFLAIPIDGFLDFSQFKPVKSTPEIVSILRQNSFAGFNLLASLKTDLTMWELVRLKISLGGVRFDKVKELSLDKFGVLEQEKLADGTEVLTADPVKLDSVLLGLADPSIVSESKTIAVMNATGRPQLAKEQARLISNLGGNVIITGNAQNRLEKTRVLGEESLTLKRLRQIFGVSGKISPPDDIISSRAQINIVLGEDI